MKFLVFAIIFATANVILADWEAYRQAVLRFDALGIKNDPLYEQSLKLSETKVITFPCTPTGPSPSVPTSVHQLRPADIKVIGAVGDSLTAANGAKAVFLTGLLTEYRGLSWSMGGDADYSSVTTLPNLLRRYNPTLKGFSLGTGGYTSAGANFNVAQPGHTSHNMLAQAQLLVSRIKADKTVDFNNDWKLVTFFIGGNDLCKFCKDLSIYEPPVYVGNIEKTLDYLQSNLPRTLVNLVLTLDVKGIESLTVGYVCSTMHTYLCECGITQANAPTLDRLVEGYQRLTKALVATGKYDTTNDFTVVLQPFMEEMKPPTLANGNPDYSFFAPDCFHFSQKGHETAAMELWNNIFQRVGTKTTKWTQDVGAIVCPSATNPYIFTNKNS